MCPDSAPLCLPPKSSSQECMDDTRTFSMRLVNSPARIHTLFRLWRRLDLGTTWMGAWLSTVVGMGVEMGFNDWLPVFNWSIGKQIALTNGKSGWNRQWCVPYNMQPNPKLWDGGSSFYQYPLDQ